MAAARPIHENAPPRLSLSYPRSSPIPVPPKVPSGDSEAETTETIVWNKWNTVPAPLLSHGSGSTYNRRLTAAHLHEIAFECT